MTGLVVVLVLLAVAVGVYVLRLKKGAKAEHAARPSNAQTDVERIEAFWSWWKGASDDIAKAIDAGRAADTAEEISEHVHEISPDLAWELGPGEKSRHHLAVSSEGDPAGRILVERWLARAPSPDETWEYYPARQARPESQLSLKLGDVTLDFADYRIAFETDRTRETINASVFHPALKELPEEQRGMAVFLFLDNALGEDGVERWLGGIEPSLSEPEGGKSPTEFLAAVKELSKSATGENFAILEAKTPDGPVIASVNMSLKRIDHMLMDTHYELRITIEDPTDQGLTSPEEGPELNHLEDGLLERLGHNAVFIGHETGLGLRRIHLYAAATGPVETRIREWMKENPKRKIELTVAEDPRWEVLAKFR